MTKIPFSGLFKVTCEYHRKGSTWKAGHHTGIDLVGISSKNVYSTCIGTVFLVDYSNSYGNFVVIKEGKYYHWFCHLRDNSIIVKKGDKVSYTTIIGIMGATGNVTGAHLHYEIRKECNCYDKTINPADYMGIPNKLGIYHSQDYKINETNINFLWIPCKWTGAKTALDDYMIEIEFDDKKEQIWIDVKELNEEKNKVKGYIAFHNDSSKDYLVAIKGLEKEIQFWTEE